MGLDDLEELQNVRGESGFSHRFFRNLDQVQDNEFENYVLDVNIVYSVAAGRRYFSDVFADSDAAKEAWEILDNDSLQRKDDGGKAVL